MANSKIHSLDDASSSISLPKAGEKDTVAAAVQDVTRLSNGFHPLSTVTTEEWTPGVRKRFPWLGAGALMLILNCTMATIFVLRFSDGQQAAKWCRGKIAPNVFISIFNSITNLAIAVAIFLRFKYFNFIALATLGTKLAVVDSVLYQRALTSDIRVALEPEHNNHYSTFASRIFPVTAVMGHDPWATSNMADTFEYDLFSWMRTPYISRTGLSTLPCNADTCTFGLEAAGFSVDCKQSYTPIDYGVDAPVARSRNQTSGYQNLPLFSMEWSYHGPDDIKPYSRIVLNTTYVTRVDVELGTEDSEGTSLAAQYGTCPTNMTISLCEFRPAVLNYTVIQSNQGSQILTGHDAIQGQSALLPSLDSTVKLGRYDQLGFSCEYPADWCGLYNESWRQYAGTTVLRNVDVAEPFEPGTNSTLFGFYLAFKSYYSASATATWNGKDWLLYENGSLPFTSGGWLTVPEGYCNFTYQDPLSQILQQINLLSATVAVNPTYFHRRNGDGINPASTGLADLVNAGEYDEIFDKLSAWTYLNAIYDLAHPLGDFDSTEVNVQNTTALLLYKDIFYSTEWPWMYGAIGATVVILLCIIPVYWGFWELGRKVSLGPFEIAHAFQSPAFASVHVGTGQADEVLKAIGKSRFQYGEVVDAAGRRYVFQAV